MILNIKGKIREYKRNRSLWMGHNTSKYKGIPVKQVVFCMCFPVDVWKLNVDSVDSHLKIRGLPMKSKNNCTYKVKVCHEVRSFKRKTMRAWNGLDLEMNFTEWMSQFKKTMSVGKQYTWLFSSITRILKVRNKSNWPILAYDLDLTPMTLIFELDLWCEQDVHGHCTYI